MSEHLQWTRRYACGDLAEDATSVMPREQILGPSQTFWRRDDAQPPAVPSSKDIMTTRGHKGQSSVHDGLGSIKMLYFVSHATVELDYLRNWGSE